MPRQHRHDYAADLHRDLLTDTPSRLRSRPSTLDGRALHPGPYPPDLSRCHAYGAFNTGSCRIPSDLARRTQPVWQYQAVPALSALLPTLPGVSRIRLRSASTGLLRQPSEKAFHLLQLRAPHDARNPPSTPSRSHSKVVSSPPPPTNSRDQLHRKSDTPVLSGYGRAKPR
jgi:hypothetical protein